MRTFAAALALALVVCALVSCVKKVDTAAEEQQIRAQIQALGAAVQAGDSTAIVNFYVEDAHLMPPNMPEMVGRDQIRTFWSTIVKIPNFRLAVNPTNIWVAQAADVAEEIGTYQASMDGPAGPIQDSGKYAISWRKATDGWKMHVYIFNSDLPATPPMPSGGPGGDTTGVAPRDISRTR